MILNMPDVNTCCLICGMIALIAIYYITKKKDNYYNTDDAQRQYLIDYELARQSFEQNHGGPFEAIGRGPGLLGASRVYSSVGGTFN